MTSTTRTRLIRGAATLALAGAALGGGFAQPASAAPASAAASATDTRTWMIPDVGPRPGQLVGDLDLFADFGNYPKIAPTGAHLCNLPEREHLMGTIAGRVWSYAEDYTTDEESLHKNAATVSVSGWTDGQEAMWRLANDRLQCTWLDPQQPVDWPGTNPGRVWYSTSGKVYGQYVYTSAMRVGDHIVSVTSRSNTAATAQQITKRLTLAVERNLRATDLARAAG